MINRKTDFFCIALLATSVSACSAAALPEPKLTSAKTSVSAAEAVGAVDEPKAALHLKMAQDAIVEAEKFIADNKNEKAIPLLERALADAQLARELTDEAEGQRSADEATARLAALQQTTSSSRN